MLPWQQNFDIFWHKIGNKTAKIMLKNFQVYKTM